MSRLNSQFVHTDDDNEDDDDDDDDCQEKKNQMNPPLNNCVLLLPKSQKAHIHQQVRQSTHGRVC